MDADHGLTSEQTEAAAWTVAPGVEVGGAGGIALALAVAWGTRLPLLPWKVPGGPWLLDRCYELVARNRRRLPGAEPWCVAHPGDCRPVERAA